MPLAPDAAKDAKLRSSLLALGYNEAVSLTFIAKENAAKFSSAEPLALANPPDLALLLAHGRPMAVGARIV